MKKKTRNDRPSTSYHQHRSKAPPRRPLASTTSLELEKGLVQITNCFEVKHKKSHLNENDNNNNEDDDDSDAQFLDPTTGRLLRDTTASVSIAAAKNANARSTVALSPKVPRKLATYQYHPHHPQSQQQYTASPLVLASSPSPSQPPLTRYRHQLPRDSLQMLSYDTNHYNNNNNRNSNHKNNSNNYGDEDCEVDRTNAHRRSFTGPRNSSQHHQHPAAPLQRAKQLQNYHSPQFAVPSTATCANTTQERHQRQHRRKRTGVQDQPDIIDLAEDVTTTVPASTTTGNTTTGSTTNPNSTTNPPPTTTNTTPPSTTLYVRTPIQLSMTTKDAGNHSAEASFPLLLAPYQFENHHLDEQDDPIPTSPVHPPSPTAPSPPSHSNNHAVHSNRNTTTTTTNSSTGTSTSTHSPTTASIATTISTSKSNRMTGSTTKKNHSVLEVGQCKMSFISRAQRSTIFPPPTTTTRITNHHNPNTHATTNNPKVRPPKLKPVLAVTSPPPPAPQHTQSTARHATTTTTTNPNQVVNLCDAEDSHTDNDDNGDDEDIHIVHQASERIKNDVATPFSSSSPPLSSQQSQQVELFSTTTSLSSDRTMISPPKPSLRQQQRRRQSQLDDEEEMQYVKNIADHTTTTTSTTTPVNNNSPHSSDDTCAADTVIGKCKETKNDNVSELPTATVLSSSSSLPSDHNNNNNNNNNQMDSLDYEEEKSSKCIVRRLQRKHGNQLHSINNNDDDGNEDPYKCSKPSTRKRRLHSSDDNTTTRNSKSSEHEDVLDDDDLRVSQSDEICLVTYTNSKKRHSSKKDEDSDDMDAHRIDSNHTTTIAEETSSKRRKNQGTSTVATTSAKEVALDYMSIVEDIENYHVAIPLKPASRAAVLNSPPARTMSWNVGSMVDAVVRQPAQTLMSLIQKKVSSPDHNHTTSTRTKSAFFTAMSERARPCQPPKVKHKSGPSNVIRPGDAIRSHQSSGVHDDTMEFNDDDEYFDHHPYNARPQTRSERRKSNQPLEKVAAQHPTARNTLSSQQTRNKVNDHESSMLDDSGTSHQRSSYSFRETTSRKSQERQRRSGTSVIEIDSSSDDDSMLEPPTKASAAARHVSRSVEFEIFRIAIGRQVFFNDCLFGFHLPSTKSRETTLQLEYKKQTRHQQNRSAYATRRRAVGNTSDTDGDDRLHLINMTQDLLELKFYIPEQYTDENTRTIDDAADDAIHLTNNLLAMRIQTTTDNGLNAFPNTYKPDSDDPERQWIVIELCTESDMNDFLSAIRKDLHLSVFATNESRLSLNEARAICKSLLKDNAMQEQQAHREYARTKSIGAFLHGKAEDDVLLVYPFGADSKTIDTAAMGLKELSCVLEYENNNPGPSDANAISTSTKKEELSSEDNTTDRAVLTLAVSTIERLEPGVYLNDTLIDFWQQWIWRNNDKSLVHYFTTLFFTSLEENDPEAVKRWTEKRGVDVFTKRYIFIPINKSLHWSLCVVVNPGAIIAHRNCMLEDCNSNTTDVLSDDDPFPCILFFDSLKAHTKNRFAKLVRTWLNSEWKRLYPQQSEQSPFDVKSMRLYSPTIPYQNNSWDCGVYVCRYMYAMYLLRSHKFSYAEVGDFKQSEDSMFRELITNHAAFRFGSEDIVRMRYEFMTLIERLSKLFFKWKADDDRQRLEARRLKKAEETDINSKSVVTQML